jgi:hypothetical protein
MADGGRDPEAAEILRKEQQKVRSRVEKADERTQWKTTKDNLLRRFRKWIADGVIGTAMRCPLCKQEIRTKDFETHVRKTH